MSEYSKSKLDRDRTLRSPSGSKSPLKSVKPLIVNQPS
jgi:hypothetical protein